MIWLTQGLEGSNSLLNESIQFTNSGTFKNDKSTAESMDRKSIRTE